jgi:hypothetical protein
LIQLEGESSANAWPSSRDFFERQQPATPVLSSGRCLSQSLRNAVPSARAGRSGKYRYLDRYTDFPSRHPDYAPRRLASTALAAVTTAEGSRGILAPSPPPPAGAARGGTAVIGDGAGAEAACVARKMRRQLVLMQASLVMAVVLFYPRSASPVPWPRTGPSLTGYPSTTLHCALRTAALSALLDCEQRDRGINGSF